MSLDFLSNLSRVIGQVSKEKGVSEAVVVDSIVQGVLSAVRKKYGTYRDIEVKYNEKEGELELFEFKKIVKDDEFEDELIEIKYSEAKDLDPSVHIGDQVGMRLELKDLGRIDAQAAKQIIIQNLRSIEHEIIFNEFEKRKGEVTSGVVRRVDPGMIVVDLDKTEAYIPRREQIPGEEYKAGDRIQGYLLEVRQTTRGPQIIMSRTHEQYLIKLFENEVPEVSEGIVKIVAAAREPGQRAKMSVYSTDPAVHPVGSCVGIKGSRVQNITQELKGERVDVIIWENDLVKYICNALAPAKIAKILMNEDEKSMQIIVPDDQLSLAIGKKGQNVRLAVKLTGWNLNLVSEEEFKKAKKEALFNLSLISDMTETKAQSLFQYGFSSVQQIAESSPEDLKSIPEFEDLSISKKFIASARELLQKYEKEGKELPSYEEQKQKAKPLSSSLKEQAEEILKRELAQLEEDKPTKEGSEEDSSSGESVEVKAANPEEASKKTENDEKLEEDKPKEGFEEDSSSGESVEVKAANPEEASKKTENDEKLEEDKPKEGSEEDSSSSESVEVKAANPEEASKKTENDEKLEEDKPKEGSEEDSSSGESVEVKAANPEEASKKTENDEKLEEDKSKEGSEEDSSSGESVEVKAANPEEASKKTENDEKLEEDKSKEGSEEDSSSGESVEVKAANPEEASKKTKDDEKPANKNEEVKKQVKEKQESEKK